MKTTLTMLVILLTMCLAASAFATSPKRTAAPTKPMKEEEIHKDQLYQRYWNAYRECVAEIPEKEAFNHATSSAFFVAVRAKVNEKCRAYERMTLLRMCELTRDPAREFDPKAPCNGGQYLEKFIDEILDSHSILLISNFDGIRAEKGLPPRPSIDK